MLTQLRRWGWLFNPITLYVVWPRSDDAHPGGLVLEVTNTPWKERHRYAVALDRCGPDGQEYIARVSKSLHVSPFLDENYEYLITLSFDEVGRTQGDDRSIELSIDVASPNDHVPIVSARLSLAMLPPSRGNLTRALATPLPTHRVSVGIHLQALRLWLKRVPFVSHPSKRGKQRQALR